MNEIQADPPDAATGDTAGPRPESPSPRPPIPETLPIILSAATVMYPQQLIPVLATEPRDIQAIDQAATSEAKIVGVFAQQPTGEGRHDGAPYEVGTAATMVRMAKGPDGSAHAILQGVARIRLLSIEQEDPWVAGRVEELQETTDENLEVEALMRDVSNSFQRVTDPRGVRTSEVP